MEHPGRYIIESGCRRVGDAQIADCLQALRKRDRFVELTFRPARTWRGCFVTYAAAGADAGKDGADHAAQIDAVPQWFMVPMQRAALRDSCWVATLDARRGVDCAFTDGADEWDSNGGANFLTRVPDRYSVEGGQLRYGGVSELDLHMSGERR